MSLRPQKSSSLVIRDLFLPLRSHLDDIFWTNHSCNLASTIYKIRESHIFRKRITEKLKILYETEYKFRFTKVWNGFCNLFHKKKIANFFLKRIIESVSQFCEMEFVFRFAKNFNFFQNGLRNPFPGSVKRNLQSDSMCFFRKRVLGSVCAFPKRFFHLFVVGENENVKK